MKTILFATEKGGVGRTTISSHFAAFLAMGGYTVLYLDADPQSDATQRFGVNPQPGFYHLVVRPDQYDVSDVGIHIDPERYKLADRQVNGELFLVPSNRESYAIPNLVEDLSILRLQLEELDNVDFCIIDMPPTPGMLLVLAMAASDYFIMPTQLEIDSLNKIPTGIRQMEAKGLELLGIVPNMYQHQTNLHRHNYTELIRLGQANNWYITKPISKRIAYPESAQLSKMVWQTEQLKGSDQATKELWRTCASLVARIGASSS